MEYKYNDIETADQYNDSNIYDDSIYDGSEYLDTFGERIEDPEIDDTYAVDDDSPIMDDTSSGFGETINPAQTDEASEAADIPQDAEESRAEDAERP